MHECSPHVGAGPVPQHSRKKHMMMKQMMNYQVGSSSPQTSTQGLWPCIGSFAAFGQI
jgi:hypothetical protein